jgi:hypothetical protein
LWGYLNKRAFSCCFDNTEEQNTCIHAEIRGILEEMLGTSGRLDFYKTLNPNICTFNKAKETQLLVMN